MPIKLRNIKANIFVDTAFFDIIPYEMSIGTVISEVHPTDTLNILTVAEVKHTTMSSVISILSPVKIYVERKLIMAEIWQINVLLDNTTSVPSE